MLGVKLALQIMADDGADGVFWRGGRAYVRFDTAERLAEAHEAQDWVDGMVEQLVARATRVSLEREK